MKPDKQDVDLLNKCYENRIACYGQLHDHSDSGGRSDGHCTLTEWKEGLAALSMDFATLVDHRQVLHMYQPEWDDRIFIGGTEPGTVIRDSKARNSMMHYNMIFSKPEQLQELLTEFTEYEYAGGREDTYRYSRFNIDRFGELIDAIREKGGFFVHPHPKQLTESDDPLDYWFRDETGLEVFYTFHQELDGEFTQANYKLWTDLLALGKRVWATAGNDEHRAPSVKAMTTIFSPEKHSRAYIACLRRGDFVCGGVGIRMCIGDTAMGGKCDFAGQRLVFSVGDFHESQVKPEHAYRVDLLDDTGVIFSSPVDPGQTVYFAADVDASRKFYRVEVFDTTEELRIAIGNPIWNT